MDQGFDEAVRRIVEARKTLVALEGLPEPGAPATLAEGYRMQKAVVGRWDDGIAGWKVGATAKQMQDVFGISEPVYGPVFRKTVFQSPAVLPAQSFHHRMLETEFTFRFGEDLPARSAPYSRNEIVAAIDAVVPSFELISPRFRKLPADKIAHVVADFCANGGAVLGPVCERWRGVDLPSHAVKFYIGGTLRQEGSGALVLGDPLNVAEWFVNTLRAQGLRIARGEFVMTGTMTGLHAVEIGQRAVADFGDLGRVEVEFR
jgi:2-keto-4-pentenoate hydratase